MSPDESTLGTAPEQPAPGAGKDEVVEVAAGLLFRHGKLLITQRRRGDHLGGFWEFPGGKREGDETFGACVERELKEELGIEVEAGELLDSITHAYPEKTVRLNFFRCSSPRGEPRPLGCEMLAWVAREDLGRYHFPPADSRLLDLLRQRLDLWE